MFSWQKCLLCETVLGIVTKISDIMRVYIMSLYFLRNFTIVASHIYTEAVQVRFCSSFNISYVQSRTGVER